MKRLILFLLCCVAIPAMAVCDVTMTGTVYDDKGNEAGGGTNWWRAVPEVDVKKLNAEGDKVIAFAQKTASKKEGGDYQIVYTGQMDCDGVVTPEKPVTVTGLTNKEFVAVLRRTLQFAAWTVDWADDDVKKGKRHGWDHSKSKVKKDK